MQSMNKVWYLRRLDLFLSLTDKEIEELARALNDHYVPERVELLHDRQHQGIYIIKRGAVRLYAGDDSQQVTLALLGPGRMFGLSPRVGQNNPLLGATTLEPSYICFTTTGQMMQAFARYPDVLLKMLHALIEQLFHAETWVERIHSTTPRKRLANLLIELCEHFCDPTEHGMRVRHRLTQADLARLINVSRETLNRLMREFERAGWVGREHGLLVIRDEDALHRVSREDDGSTRSEEGG